MQSDPHRTHSILLNKRVMARGGPRGAQCLVRVMAPHCLGCQNSALLIEAIIDSDALLKIIETKLPIGINYIFNGHIPQQMCGILPRNGLVQESDRKTMGCTKAK